MLYSNEGNLVDGCTAEHHIPENSNQSATNTKQVVCNSHKNASISGMYGILFQKHQGVFQVPA